MGTINFSRRERRRLNTKISISPSLAWLTTSRRTLNGTIVSMQQDTPQRSTFDCFHNRRQLWIPSRRCRTWGCHPGNFRATNRRSELLLSVALTAPAWASTTSHRLATGFQHPCPIGCLLISSEYVQFYSQRRHHRQRYGAVSDVRVTAAVMIIKGTIMVRSSATLSNPRTALFAGRRLTCVWVIIRRSLGEYPTLTNAGIR